MEHRSETGRNFVWLGSDQGFGREVRGIDTDEGKITAEQVEVDRAAKTLLADLDELRGPPRKTSATPNEWVPPHVTIEVRAEYDTRYYTTENYSWPFEDSIEMVRALEAGAAMTLCLTGADAALAWELFMIDGVNHVRLPVEVVGAAGSVLLREAGLTISYPLYNPSGSACPTVASINPPS